MKYENIIKKITNGVALSKRQDDKRLKLANIRYNRALKSFQVRALAGFGEAGFVDQLRTGSMLPDSLFGWSTKTVLAGLLVLLALKLKSKL